jgi:tetratricopeptide (TPR) repeat protein
VEQYVQEAVRLAELTGDQRNAATSLTSLAMLEQTRGDFLSANKKLERSLQISRREGYTESIEDNLRWLGTHDVVLGDYERAIERCSESLPVAREISFGFGEMLSLAWISQAQINLGSYREAIEVIREGMSMAQERDNKFIIARLPNHLGWIHRLFGDFSTALDYDQESAELGRTFGQHYPGISALISLGADFVGLGQLERARSHLGEVLARVDAGEFSAHECLWKQRLLYVLAETAYAMGDHGEALRYVDASLSVAVAHWLRKYVAKGWGLRGRIRAELGQADAAGEDLQRAMALAEELKSPSVIYPIAYDLGRWHESAGRDQEAGVLYAKAKGAIDRMVDAIDDHAVQSTFLQSEPVQAVMEGLGRAG